MGARPSSFVQEDKPVLAPVWGWSAQQHDIFGWFSNYGEPSKGDSAPLGHLIVRARAGTGKTTTIIEGVNRAPESSILVCAFNKRIAEALNAKIANPAAEAKTMHAVGFVAIRQQWRGIKVAEGSTRADSLTDMVVPKDCPKPIRRLVSQLHTKARDMMPLTPDIATLTALALEFDYVPDEGWTSYGLEFVVARAQEAMSIAASQDPTYDIGIDFADMIYLPLVWKLLQPEYDLVVVDEAQDLTLAQLTIAQRICNGRICVVGDDKQAIYGFRGADSGSLDRLKRELGAAELPLTTTYRCCQAVVKRAQKLVPDIIAGPTNPEGVVDAIEGVEALLEAAEAGQFILSRLNAPLVSITLQLLKRKKRASMAGRDIAAGIQAVLRKITGHDPRSVVSMVTLSLRLDAWEAKTVTRFANFGQVQLIDRTHDQADMIRALAQDAESIEDLQNRIDWLFSDETGDHEQILCSSIHKAKGLEAERVYVLQESFYRRGVTSEEDNIFYVAQTRAKNHLTFVTGVM